MYGYISGKGTVPRRGLVALAKLLLPLVLLGLLAGLLWSKLWRPPESLDEVTLAGARGPACVRLLLVPDQSGSMSAFAAARERAVQRFLGWAPGNLRPDDEVGVLDFASEAQWSRMPAPIDTDASYRNGTADLGGGTQFAPVIEAVRALPASRCDTALVLLSDAQIDGVPSDRDAGRQLMQELDVHDVALLVPDRAIEVWSGWATVFPTAQPEAFNGLDDAETGLVFAAQVATLTGQELVTHR